ncbi:MAG: hemagglutinin repeat-containing protein, partial [Desulfobulbus sp.]|nr:hemagglutinin repeat-containing protein [Desulfobulbus sp.]
TYQSDAWRKIKKSDGWSSSKQEYRDKVNETTHTGSTFSGDTVLLQAGLDPSKSGNLALVGSNAVSTNGTALIASGDITLTAAADTRNESHHFKKTGSGFAASGASISYGKNSLSVDQQGQIVSQQKSTVGSIEGDILIQAGNAYTQTGSDVIALQGDVDILAKTVDIQEARETAQSKTETQFKQTGITIAISNPVVSAIQTAEQMNKASKNTRDGRMKALAAGAAGLSGYNAADAVKSGQGDTINGKDNQIQTGTDADGKAITRDATAADKAGGIGISLSVGSSQSSSKTEQASNTASGSTVLAGGNINITATGAGEASNITIQGSDITAGNTVNLIADNDIRLLAAQNTASQHSSNKSSSASVGVSFRVGSSQGNGFMLTVSASGARGNADGSDLVWSNTHVSAGNQVNLQSGGDTQLIGATVTAPQVTADIGGDLLIQSLQDISHYDSKQQSLGGSVSIGFGQMGGSLSYSQSKIKSDYASVQEQSGIRAGDEGFQINVQGDTTLTGGAITSTQQAIDDDKNRFHTGGELTLSDIQNHASYEASSVGVNIGAAPNLSGQFTPQGAGAGIGSDSDSDSSVTQAAISGIAGNAEARTGDAETGLNPIFDADKVQKEIDAQVMITREFGAQATQAIKTEADRQRKELQDQLRERQNQLSGPLTEKRREEIKAEMSEIRDQIAQINRGERIANVIVGVLAGQAGSAITKGVLSELADLATQDQIKSSLKGPVLCIPGDTKCVSNATKPTEGVLGYVFGLAGGRLDLALWCKNDACTKSENNAPTDAYSVDPKTGKITYYAVENGVVEFKPTKEGPDGEPIPITSMHEFIDNHPERDKLISPLGGIQGWDGQLRLPLIGDIKTPPGGFLDKLVESYAGTHDWLNSFIWYDTSGNAKNLDGTPLGKAGDVMNWVNVLLATPTAASIWLSPGAWNALGVIVK